MPSALALESTGAWPDGTVTAVQVGRFVLVEPLGAKAPGRPSIMFFPMTDSLGGTIADCILIVHRPVARVSSGSQEYGGLVLTLSERA